MALDPTSSGDFDNFSVKHVDQEGAVVDAVVTLPHTSGAHVVYFKSNQSADITDFTIVATSGNDTEGALGLDTLTLTRCADNALGDGEAWWKIRPVEGAATIAALSIVGDDFAADITTPTLIAVPESADELGLFSRITGTAGVVHAYRTAYGDGQV